MHLLIFDCLFFGLASVLLIESRFGSFDCFLGSSILARHEQHDQTRLSSPTVHMCSKVHGGATAPHGRVARKAGYGHVHQGSIAIGILADQIGPPGAKMPGRTRIFKSALHAPSIAVLGIQKHIPQLL